MDGQRTDELTQRVVRLERQNRYIKWSGFVLGAVFFSGLVMCGLRLGGMTARTESEAFALRDSAGSRRAVLTLMEGGPRLAFFDDDANERVTLSLTERGPELLFCNKDGVPQVDWGLSELGPYLNLHREDGRSGVTLNVIGMDYSAHLEPAFCLFGRHGEVTLSFDMGAPYLRFHNKDRKLVFSAP